MKTTLLWAPIALPAVLAQTTTTTTSPSSTTSAAPTCTASLTTKLCDYKETEFALAEDNRNSCFAYCNSHPPCSFVIWNPGNPYLGTGTCWVYPGEDYDESAGSATGCDNTYLEVYSKPTCSGGATPTTTSSGACVATQTPSPIASVCGYPAPDDNCFYSCAASEGAVDCLSQCVEAESCSYAVFKAGTAGSPYGSGTCWRYANGTYDEKSAGECSGKPEQYVYTNPCPKPAKASGAEKASKSESGDEPEATGGSDDAEAKAKAEAASQGEKTGVGSSVGTGFSLGSIVGAAVLMWQACR